MISDKILLKKWDGSESIELNQNTVKIRENRKGLMALSYVAPIFEIIDLEDFFENMDSSAKLIMDIGGTGEVCMSFRGLINGKGVNFPQNLDHRIILLEESYCPKPGEYMQVKRVSKFMPRDRFS